MRRTLTDAERVADDKLSLDIHKMRLDGVQYADICSQLNVTNSRIRRALLKYGHASPTHMTRFTDAKENILKAYWDGVTINSLVIKYGVKQEWASKKLKQWGAVRSWDVVEQSMERLLIKDAHGDVANADVDELFFIYRESLSHQVLLHWREYERLKKLAGEEI